LIPLIINKKKYSAPSCKEELTVAKYQEIVTDWDQEDIIKLFSILVGCDYIPLKDSEDFDLQNTIYVVVDFIYRSDFTFDEIEKPVNIKIKDKILTIPTNLKSLTLEQSIHVRQKIERANEGSGKIGECISFATAIYLQPLFDGGKFDKDRVDALEKEILKMSIVDIYPIGFFFLKKYARYGSRLTRILSRIKIWWTQLQIKSLKWLKLAG